MLLNHLIIDDFLSEPETVRKVALGLNYPKPDKATYFPGRNSQQPLPTGDLDKVVQELVGEPLRPAPGTAHGKCRITLQEDKGDGNVHIDKAHWSGILYLNLPHQCQGGTDFFRHLPTDTERAPVTPEDLKRMGYKHATEVWDDFLLKDTNDESKWEKIYSVPMRFNRLTLFRPWLWHNAGPSFGQCKETGRLVMLLFYVQA